MCRGYGETIKSAYRVTFSLKTPVVVEGEFVFPGTGKTSHLVDPNRTIELNS